MAAVLQVAKLAGDTSVQHNMQALLYQQKCNSVYISSTHIEADDVTEAQSLCLQVVDTTEQDSESFCPVK